MSEQPLKPIIEAALFVAGKPLSIDNIIELFSETDLPDRSAIRAALKELREDYAERGVELVQAASGYRFQTKPYLTRWLKRLQPERSPRYSRALLETMAIIAYRQPITRSEIEKIRGISVSTELMKRLQDYNWIRILARKDSPGKPALYGTTREFLNYFNLKALNELPPLSELSNFIELQTAVLESENKPGEVEVVTEEESADIKVIDSEEKTIPQMAEEAIDSEEIESENQGINQAAEETVVSKKVQSENNQLNQAALEAVASETIESEKIVLNQAALEALASETIESENNRLNQAALEALASENNQLNEAAEEAVASEIIESEKIVLNQAAQEALASEYTSETEPENNQSLQKSSESEEQINKPELKKDNTNQLAFKL